LFEKTAPISIKVIFSFQIFRAEHRKRYSVPQFMVCCFSNLSALYIALQLTQKTFLSDGPSKKNLPECAHKNYDVSSFVGQWIVFITARSSLPN
jgi:hypothetical protein